MGLSRLTGVGLLNEFPDKEYARVVQEKIEATEENPYAVAQVLGKFLQPVLSRAKAEEDYELVCVICDIFRRVKELVFNEGVVCSAECEVGLKRVLHRALGEDQNGGLGTGI